MKNYKKKTGKKTKVITGVILAAIMFAGGGAAGYGMATDFSYKKVKIQQEQTIPNTPDDGTEQESSSSNLVLSDVENAGMQFKRRALSLDEYEAYGIDANNVKSVYTASVTLENQEEATDKTINLSLSFVRGEEWNVWSVGKTEKDYVQLSKDKVQSGEVFTIACTQAFGAPILITASTNVPKDKDIEPQTCSIQADYVARFGDNLTMKMGCDVDQDFSFYPDVPYNEITFTLNSGTPGNAQDYYIWLDTEIENNFAENLNAFEIKCGYGVGTVKENFGDNPIVGIEIFNGNNSYSPKSKVDFSFSADEDRIRLSKTDSSCFFNGSFASEWNKNIETKIQEYAGGTYNEIESRGQDALVTMCITFKGGVTGETYRYVAFMQVLPDYMYVPGANPSFDGSTSGGILF